MGGKLGTKEESEKIIELYKNGLSNKQISKSIGRSEYFVRTRIEKYQKNNEIYVPELLNEEELLEKIINMHKKGLSPREIAHEIGKSYEYVCNRVNKYKDKFYIDNWGE